MIRLSTGEMRAIISDIKAGDYSFRIFEENGRPILQAAYLEADVDDPTNTGDPPQPVEQRTRKWFLSPFMTKSELVQTAFKCILTSAEHRTREAFTYRGQRVFGPHFDVDALHKLAEEWKFDVRKEKQ